MGVHVTHIGKLKSRRAEPIEVNNRVKLNGKKFLECDNKVFLSVIIKAE